MKSLACLAVAASLLNVVSAHYRWTSLIVNGTTTAEYQYVRQNTNDNSPVTDVTSNDIRCNVGGETSTNTQTATVTAGSTIGFALDQPLYHAGVINAYLGQVPDGETANSWDGSSAEWFKVSYEGPTFTSSGPVWPTPAQYTFPLPTDIASGQYLARIEQIALHVTGAPQFYISCAQLDITGGSGGSPTKVSFPGAYSLSDPGLAVNIYNPVPTSYTDPGPAVYN